MECSSQDQSVKPYLLLFLIASLPFLWNLYIERFFSADGAHYFAGILDQRYFTDFAWARNHAVYLSQWPLVVATRLGITNLTLLKIIFAFGLYLPAIGTFLICLLVADREHRPLLVFPVISFLTITNVIMGAMVSEAHVLTYLSWPIFFLLIRDKPYSPGIAVLLALLLFAYTRCYQSAVITGLIFSGLMLARLQRHTSFNQRILNICLLLLILAAVIIAAKTIIIPRDPGNRAGFIDALFRSSPNPLFLCTVPFVILFFWGWLSNSNFLKGLGLVLSLAGYFYLVFYGAEIGAHASFRTRTLTAFYLPALLICAWVISKRNLELPRQSWQVVLIFTCFSSMAQIHSAGEWVDFRDQFKFELSRHNGFVKREDTAVHAHSHNWGWTAPTLSYLWSEGEVKTIILNPENVQWQPFDPRTRRILSNYIPSVPPIPEITRARPIKHFDSQAGLSLHLPPDILIYLQQFFITRKTIQSYLMGGKTIKTRGQPDDITAKKSNPEF